MLRTTPQARANRIDPAIDLAVTTGVAVLVLVGFATSYHTLLDLAATSGGYPTWLAPSVPLSFDLGIIVLSLKVAQAAHEGRHAPILRFLVASLSAATVVANASAVPGLGGRILHAVPPAMFVICFESVVITARRHALQARDAWPEPIPRQHLMRWLLAPRSTWSTWRTAVLGTKSDPASPQLANERHLSARETSSPAAASQPVVASSRRRDLVVAALQRDARASAPALRSLLAEHGHQVSLRSVQRLRAAAIQQLTQ